MCAGSHLANRELFTAYVRLITAFKITPPKNQAEAPIIDAIECNSMPTALTTDPKPFKIGLKARNEDELRQWLTRAADRTKGL